MRKDIKKEQEIMLKKTEKTRILKEFYAEVGEVICKAFSKSLSHPYVRVDMSPDFDNLLILTFGRGVYKFMMSKEGQKIWAELNQKYAQKMKAL
jgi:hypothetical protein